MKHLLILPFILIVFACSTAKKSPAPAPKPVTQPADVPVSSNVQNINWLDSERLMPVLEMAQREKKPVFVVFYASWCAPCKVMEEEIFTQPEVYRYLNTNFLNFHSNYDAPAGKTIAEIFEVASLPTVLFVDPQGVVLERYTGMAGLTTLKSLGGSALKKMGK